VVDLEYTINPRTGKVDAVVLRNARTVAAATLCSGRSAVNPSTGNRFITLPTYRDPSQWKSHGSHATAELAALGELARRGKAAAGAPEDPLLAPLRPLLVAVKTAMVTSCDGAKLDLHMLLVTWRLILALTDPRVPTGLKRRAAVEASLESFRSGKGPLPSDLGNFIAQLLVVEPARWGPILERYLHTCMAKNVKWVARDLVLKGQAALLRHFTEKPSSDADADAFLETAFKASAVSRRTVLFWAALGRAVAQSSFLGKAEAKAEVPPSRAQADWAAFGRAVTQNGFLGKAEGKTEVSLSRARAEEIHGFRPTPALCCAVTEGLTWVNAVDSWKSLFVALEAAGSKPASSSVSTPSSMDRAELLFLMRASWTEGIARGHFAADTDFAKIHANGTSNLFFVGKSYDKAAFCLDRSGSMATIVGTQTRYELVSIHLLELLEERSSDFAFSVQLFDNEITRFEGWWTKKSCGWRTGGLVQNTPAVRAELKRFLDENGPRGGTDIALALRSLVEVDDARELFLLTDGEDPSSEREALQLAAASNAKGVPLNCIGVDVSEYYGGQAFLRRAAKAGGGDCSVVDKKQLKALEEDSDDAAFAA